MRENTVRKRGTVTGCPESESRQQKATRLSRLNPTRRRCLGLCLSASSVVHPTFFLLSLSFLLPFKHHAIFPMATQSQDVPQETQQQPSSIKPLSKRFLFARSSSKRRSKNKEIQSTSPPEINSNGQSPPSQPDNPPGAPSVPTPSEATATAAPPSSSPPTTGQNGHPTSHSATSNTSASPRQESTLTASQAPASQAPTQLATTSSTTVASLPGSSTPSAPAASEPTTDDPDREKERDKGSLSTTLTGTHPTRVSRKGAQTASEGAHSSTAVEQPSSPKSAAKHRANRSPSSPRMSFISRLLRFLLPCVPSSRLINEAANEVDSDPTSSATALREKASARDAEKDSSLRPVEETPVTIDSASEQPHPNAELAPSTSGLVPESGPRPLHVVPPTASTSDKDLDIIVPPTPTKVIPESETGGVTSSAVVPPGSTAEEVTHLRALQAHESSSGDESDGTSFTEDEEVEDVPGIDEVEDDEDRLILNGGAGIPIGPVSYMTLLSIIFHCSHLSQRMEFHGRSCPQSPLNTWDANAWFLISTRHWCTVVSRCAVFHTPIDFDVELSSPVDSTSRLCRARRNRVPLAQRLCNQTPGR
jgi:hypothetical protein